MLKDADKDSETMIARVVRYDREHARLELAAPNTTVVFSLYGDGEQRSAAKPSIGIRRAPTPTKSEGSEPKGGRNRWNQNNMLWRHYAS